MRIAAVGAALAGVAVIIGLGQDVTSVTAKCPKPGPPRGDNWPHYYHDGLKMSRPDNGGIYAKLYNTTPWVEPGSGFRFAASWIGIDSVPSLYLWAQIGWIEEPSGEHHDYYEYFLQDAAQYRRYQEFPPQPLYSQTYYAVFYDPYTTYLTFQINGVTTHRQRIGWVPNEVRMSGEINTLASQMPGGYSGHMFWEDTHVWYNGGWQTPSWGNWTIWNEGSSCFANWPHDYSELDIWDWSCYD